VLEDRLAPAVLKVNSLLGVIDHSDGLLTLSEAVAAVKARSTEGFSDGEKAAWRLRPTSSERGPARDVTLSFGRFAC
jgi:hypothetical protein